MEKIVKLGLVLGFVALLGFTVGCPAGGTVSSTTTVSSAAASSVPAGAFEVTVNIKPAAGMGYNLYSVAGAFNTNSSNQYLVFDSSWGGGNAVAFSNMSATNAQGYFVGKILFAKTNSGAMVIQFRASTNLGVGTVYYSANITVAAISNTVSNYKVVADSYLNIAVDLAGCSNNNFNLNANATKNEIGDFWVGGRPAAVFGDYNDALSGSSKTNLNTVAYTSKDIAIFKNILIPAGTTTAVDVSIFGTNNTTGMNWTNGAKIACNTTLKNQATNTILVTAVWADGEYSKVRGTVTGDVLGTEITTY